MEKFVDQKLKLGIFVVSSITIFVIGIYLIGSKQSMFGSSSTIYVVFDNINGLRNGNNVRFSGVNVGTVKELNMISDTMIVVRASIENDILKLVKKNAIATIGSDGLVGSKIIDINPGNEPDSNLQPGDTLKASKRIRNEDMLLTLGQSNENVKKITEELLLLLEELNRGQGIIGSLIKDKEMTENVNEVVFHLKNTSVASTVTVLKLNKILDDLNKKDNLVGLMKDTTSAANVKNTIVNAEKASKELEGVLQNLNNTILNANQTIQNAKDGKGAINYLSNDEDLTKKIETTIDHLDTTVVQFNKAGIKLNENLEALKNTWLLRGYFKKVEKQKKN
jgi:phospholipid/cholesterol/gamma-HCH transport system substrate-binding protein